VTGFPPNRFKPGSGCADTTDNTRDSSDKDVVNLTHGTEATMTIKTMLTKFQPVALATMAAITLALSGTGCALNQYSGNPNTRMDQQLNQSEDLRQINEIWRRFWFNDMPSHMTPERIHGGIM
jgi:hypothetical protein